MKSNFIKILPILFVLFALGFRYFSNWCIDSLSYCYGTWINQIALIFTKPLFFFALFSLPVALILVFVPRMLFDSWLKFAAWFIPLALILIWLTPVTNQGFAYIDLYPFYRDDAARLAGGLFTLISLTLLTIKYRSLRNIS